jgi:SAM-dependent methyltransferase
MNGIKDFAAALFERLKAPGISLNISRKPAELLNSLGPRPKVLEIGSGMKRRAPYVVNMDCARFPEVNIVGDAHALPFKEGSFDAVIAQALLEHVMDPQVAAEEIRRILKKDGYVYAEIPFLQPFHPAPEDYHRYTLQGIEKLFAGFEKIETGVCVGPACAVCGILLEYMPFVIGIPVIRSVAYLILGWVLFPFRYLDIILARRKNAHMLASSLYFFGRR